MLSLPGIQAFIFNSVCFSMFWLHLASSPTLVLYSPMLHPLKIPSELGQFVCLCSICPFGLKCYLPTPIQSLLKNSYTSFRMQSKHHLLCEAFPDVLGWIFLWFPKHLYYNLFHIVGLVYISVSSSGYGGPQENRNSFWLKICFYSSDY